MLIIDEALLLSIMMDRYVVQILNCDGEMTDRYHRFACKMTQKVLLMILSYLSVRMRSIIVYFDDREDRHTPLKNLRFVKYCFNR